MVVPVHATHACNLARESGPPRKGSERRDERPAVFSAWAPPPLFGNRNRRRERGVYHQLVRDPQNTLASPRPVCR